ncbi:hypothetical protein jhhlp_006998 [Lomentospora prolificans]|uniref:Zn(2)-C6 fungal-type domain-containing protein n=1 Tax=Lomentospora prolificans TaxID=41688 RepID=A0A2N3N1G8_9PEZI|nr:hypothetical protein jhhlp_006998 [Lomentospora prolificans]
MPSENPANNTRGNGMLRRSHKSWNGCIECKSRHIKCDENRPACANCTITERTCRYPEKAASGSNASTPPPSQPLADPVPVSIPDLVPELLNSNQAQTLPDHGQEPPVNLNHMELLIQFNLSLAVPEMDDELCEKGTRVALNAAADAPYLLHEVLAFSARHLAVLRPEMAQEYLAQSVRLQNAAISYFNVGQAQVDESNCVPMILFSSILGRHLLIDALATRTPDFSHFLDRYTQSSHIRRGLRAVASGSWPFLLKTNLSVFLSWGSRYMDIEGCGEECDPLRRLIAQSSLDQEVIGVCVKTIDALQYGFDELRNMPEDNLSGQTIYTWSIKSPKEFIDLLERRVPEAIVILAYYAVLLHRSRTMWQVGDSGAYIVESIVHYLGPDWAEWLAWPQSMTAM